MSTQMIAKEGQFITAKAASELRKRFPFMVQFLTTRESCRIHSKSDANGGQWCCADCGAMFMNNSEAQGHRRSHRLAWWTGERFEAP